MAGLLQLLELARHPLHVVQDDHVGHQLVVLDNLALLVPNILGDGAIAGRVLQLRLKRAAEALAGRSDLDLRVTHRLVQDAFATAMASGKHVAVPKMPRRAGRQAIGFVADRQSGERA